MKAQRIVRLTPSYATPETIREMERLERARRIRFFCLWAINQRTVVAAFTVTSLIVMLNQGWALLSGGNGVPFLFAVLGFIGTFFGATQFVRLERGYELEDWMPRALYNKFGW